MKNRFAKRVDARKKQILKRLAIARANRFTRCFSNPDPVLASNSVKYELADRAQAINYAGVTPIIKLAEHVGLTDAINNHVNLLKWHAPYHESDNVLKTLLTETCENWWRAGLESDGSLAKFRRSVDELAILCSEVKPNHLATPLTLTHSKHAQ